MKPLVAICGVIGLTGLVRVADAEQDLSRRAAVAPDAAVEVSNVQGRVDVVAWDRNEVELKALLESDRDTLEFEATDRQVRIKVRRPEGRRMGLLDRNDDAVLTLKVPKLARLSVSTVSADILVNGVQGEQRLRSVSGDVNTRAYAQPVTLGSVSGDLTLEHAGGGAPVRTENVSGDTIAKGVKGSFDGQAVSGDISVEVAGAERVNVQTVSGDASVRSALTSNARVEMESVSGSLELEVRRPVDAEFDIESLSGEIGSCFAAKARRKSQYGPGSELVFTEGKGGARIRMQTMSGDIEVCSR